MEFLMKLNLKKLKLTNGLLLMRFLQIELLLHQKDQESKQRL